MQWNSLLNLIWHYQTTIEDTIEWFMPDTCPPVEKALGPAALGLYPLLDMYQGINHPMVGSIVMSCHYIRNQCSSNCDSLIQLLCLLLKFHCCWVYSLVEWCHLTKRFLREYFTNDKTRIWWRIWRKCGWIVRYSSVLLSTCKTANPDLCILI